MKRTRSGARLALLLVATVALVDVSVSAALRDGLFRDRPVPPFGAITHPRQREWLSGAGDATGLGAFDRELGWTVSPGFQSRLFSSNSIGARGVREYAPEKPRAALRLVAFGDSFTYCDQVADRDSWQSVLEREDPRIEAVNLGVGGYGTGQALLRFRRHGRLDADVVCIGLLLENVGRNVNRYRPLWYPRARAAAAKPRFVLGAGGALEAVPQPFATRAELCAAVLDGSVLARVAPHEHWLDRPHLGAARFSGLARLVGAVWADRQRSVSRLWRDPAGEPRRTTLAILRAFHREALAAGARAAPILVFPREADLVAIADGRPRAWSEAFEELESEGMAVIDLSVPLAEAYRHWRAEPGRTELYTGGHLSPRGNAVVAFHLLDWLAEEGLR